MKQELVQTPNGELEIQQRIRAIRGVQVMLDRDLAELYGVTTGQLNRQVKRNIKRFPSDFMFQLTKEDCLRCQIGILNGRRGEHLKFMPYAFTENGIAMLSSVLRSDTAIEVNIQIMRVFNALRHTYSSIAGVLQRLGTIEVKQIEADKKFDTIFDALDRSKLLPCGILPANSEYDSIRMVSRLITRAKSESDRQRGVAQPRLVNQLPRLPCHELLDQRSRGDQEAPCAAATIACVVFAIILCDETKGATNEQAKPTRGNSS